MSGTDLKDPSTSLYLYKRMPDGHMRLILGPEGHEPRDPLNSPMNRRRTSSVGPTCSGQYHGNKRERNASRSESSIDTNSMTSPLKDRHARTPTRSVSRGRQRRRSQEQDYSATGTKPRRRCSSSIARQRYPTTKRCASARSGEAYQTTTLRHGSARRTSSMPSEPRRHPLPPSPTRSRALDFSEERDSAPSMARVPSRSGHVAFNLATHNQKARSHVRKYTNGKLGVRDAMRQLCRRVKWLTRQMRKALPSEHTQNPDK